MSMAILSTEEILGGQVCQRFVRWQILVIVPDIASLLPGSGLQSYQQCLYLLQLLLVGLIMPSDNGHTLLREGGREDGKEGGRDGG